MISSIRSKVLPLFALLIAFLPPVQEAHAAEAYKIAVISVRGGADYLKRGETEWRNAAPGLELSPGDKLRTGERTRVEVRLGDKSLQRLYQHTELTVEQDGVKIERGKTLNRSREKALERKFSTPIVSAAIRGTEFQIEVAEDGASTVTLLEGAIDLSNAQGEISLAGGEEGVVQPGQAPRKTALINAVNKLQWTLYYPAVLEVDELGLTVPHPAPLRKSIGLYRTGALPAALAAWPEARQPASPAERLYLAALLLSGGFVGEAQEQLDAATLTGDQHRRIAGALNLLIATVKNEPAQPPAEPTLATEWMALSWWRQSRSDLDAALEAARNAVQASPEFGFAHARVAELLFGFGKTGEALEHIEEALAHSPRNAQALALRGYLLSANNRYTDALESFEAAIEADSALANAWLGRGLARIAAGEREAGRKDIETAALLEPRRSILRSYLGKAFSHEGEHAAAEKDLDRARELDPNDPTPFLYSALLKHRLNRVNEAVRDLEESQRLNENRSLFRSGLLLDQDRAVRSANLAFLYRDAGLEEVSAFEASRALQSDHANYAAHLFLANSLNELRQQRLRGVNLRLESPAVTEYLIANLLSPVGSGTLAQSITAQEYSRFFEGNDFGFSGDATYTSDGQWLQNSALHGNTRRLGYALGSFYYSDTGTRPNNDVEIYSWSMLNKIQLTPDDSVYLQAVYSESTGGDRTQTYDPDNPAFSNQTARFRDRQEPIVLAGYQHQWAPGSQTLFLAGRLHDRLEVTDPANTPIAFGAVPAGFSTMLEYESELEIYSTEAQHIWQSDQWGLIGGALFQTGDFTTYSRESTSGFAAPPIPAGDVSNNTFENDFWRGSLYGYGHWSPVNSLTATLGLAYDHVHFPRNFRNAPIENGERSATALSPKAGLVWNPATNTTLRAGYSRSLGGVSFDQSFRLEPTQVGGINQSYRSLIPESIAGAQSAPLFEVSGLALDQKFGKGTYAGLRGDLLKSEADNVSGAYFIGFAGGVAPASLEQTVSHDEKALTVYLNQLIGDEWAVGANYRISDAQVNIRTPSTGGNTDLEGTLQQSELFGLFNHPCGFFTRAEARWYHQSNRGFAPARPGDEFWHFNLLAGYRFPGRHAEIQAGILNLADRDYRLNPVNLYSEPPRERTYTVRVRVNF